MDGCWDLLTNIQVKCNGQIVSNLIIHGLEIKILFYDMANGFGPVGASLGLKFIDLDDRM
jgi:hypothetical protein